MSDTTATPTPSPNPANNAAPSAGDRRRCRGRGRGLVLLAAAAITGLVGFGIGRATGAHSRHWGGSFLGMHQTIDADSAVRRSERGVNRILGAVDGTADQKAKVNEIVKGAITDLLPMREAARGARDKLAAALKADKIDRAVIEQLRAEHLALGDKASKRVAQALADAADVLSPAQRAKLLDRWQARQRRG